MGNGQQQNNKVDNVHSEENNNDILTAEAHCCWHGAVKSRRAETTSTTKREQEEAEEHTTPNSTVQSQSIDTVLLKKVERSLQSVTDANEPTKKLLWRFWKRLQNNFPKFTSERENHYASYHFWRSPQAAHLSKEEMLVEIALALYAGERFTLAQAAHFAGLSRMEFQNCANARRIAVHYDREEWKKTVARFAHLRSVHRNSFPSCHFPCRMIIVSDTTTVAESFCYRTISPSTRTLWDRDSAGKCLSRTHGSQRISQRNRRTSTL